MVSLRYFYSTSKWTFLCPCTQLHEIFDIFLSQQQWLTLSNLVITLNCIIHLKELWSVLTWKSELSAIKCLKYLKIKKKQKPKIICFKFSSSYAVTFFRFWQASTDLSTNSHLAIDYLNENSTYGFVAGNNIQNGILLKSRCASIGSDVRKCFNLSTKFDSPLSTYSSFEITTETNNDLTFINISWHVQILNCFCLIRTFRYYIWRYHMTIKFNLPSNKNIQTNLVFLTSSLYLNDSSFAVKSCNSFAIVANSLTNILE